MFSIVRTDVYDFVVCGGGPAGFAAAVSAARKGLKTALIERQGCLGGVSTLAGINYLLAGRKLDENTQKHVRVVGGLYDELTDSLIKYNNAIEPDTIDLSFNPFGWYPRMASGIVFDAEAMKIRMDEMCTESGVRVYFYTDLIGADTDTGKIEKIYVHNKDGIVCIKAKVFADCTGDADLAVAAGCDCSLGRDSDHLTAPSSLIMHVDGVDGDALVRYQNEHNSPKLVEIIEDLKAKGIWKFPYEIFVCMQLMEKDIFLINTIRQIGVDGTSEASVSAALMQARKESEELFCIIKTYFPGFEKARIRRVFDWMGIRESRRIKAEYEVTVSDAMCGMDFLDCVAATTYNFDLPDPLKPSYDPMMGDAKKPNAQRKHVVIQIPLRSMLPQKVNNLIVAGRCIGAEREALGAIRIMGPCMQMGQAAGTAAALAAGQDCNFKKIDIHTLQDTLWSDGVLNPKELPFT